MRPRHLLLFVLAFALSAQEREQIYVTAIDVVVDVRDKAGHVPDGMKPSDFVLLEDGVERSVVGAQYLRRDAEATATAAKDKRPEWQLVLYFETELSSGVARNAIAQELIKQADALAAMGKVDVVIADPRPHALVRDSRDAEAIRDALRKVIAINGLNRLAMLRRQFIEEADGRSAVAAMQTQSTVTRDAKQNMDLGMKNTTASPTDFDITGTSPSRVTITTVRPFIQQEMQFISHFRKNLIGWLGAYGRHTPRTLLLVTDGFDVDPFEFYRERLYYKDRESEGSLEEVARISDTVNLTGQGLASAGWTTISIPGDSNADLAWSDDASRNSTGRIHQLSSSVNRNQVVRQPLQPLLNFADATGGAVVPNTGKIADAVRSIDDHILLTYQVDRKPDGKPHRIEVRARDASLKVKSARWTASATPDQMAEARAIRLLEENASGDFPVDVTAEWSAPGATKSGAVRVVAKLDSVAAFLPANHRGQFRITMAVQTANRAYAVNSILPDQTLTDASFRFRAPINVPADATAVVLVIEELSTGFWGSARLAMP